MNTLKLPKEETKSNKSSSIQQTKNVEEKHKAKLLLGAKGKVKNTKQNSKKKNKKKQNSKTKYKQSKSKTIKKEKEGT